MELKSGATFDAKIKDVDEKADIALIKIDTPVRTGGQWMKWGESEQRNAHLTGQLELFFYLMDVLHMLERIHKKYLEGGGCIGKNIFTLSF